MPTPNELGSYVDKFLDTAIFIQLVKWLGWGLLIIVVLGAFIVFYFLLQYKYKVFYPILNYEATSDGDVKVAQIEGFKKDRARTVKKKDGTVMQHILFMNKKTEKFDPEDIIPKNKIAILKVNDDGTYIPMPIVRFNTNIAAFETLTPEEKHWAILQLKENARTYSDTDELKKMRNMVLFTAILCLVLVGVTVYLSLKAPNQAAEAADRLGDTFRQIAGNLGGGTPPG